MPVKRWQHVNICSLITKRKKKKRERRELRTLGQQNKSTGLGLKVSDPKVWFENRHLGTKWSWAPLAV